MSAEARRIWTHPKLGELKLGIVDWEGRIELPSFARFDTPLPVGHYDLNLAIESIEETQPDSRLVNAAVAVIELEAVLADRVLQSVWEDLNGTGPESGNWWYGKLDSGEIHRFAGATPEKSQDLVVYLELLGVQARFVRDELPMVEFNFRASWEEEHGIGVLAGEDGEVKGIGYMHDAVPFGPPRSRTERFWNPFRQEWVDPS